jgi:hypothetical protein
VESPPRGALDHGARAATTDSEMSLDVGGEVGAVEEIETDGEVDHDSDNNDTDNNDDDEDDEDEDAEATSLGGGDVSGPFEF